MNPVKWLIRILLFLFLSHITISVDTLTPNHSINDNGDVIVSSGKIFALGFFSPGNSKNRYVGIWYDQDSKTVVWVANREKPINDTSGILSIDSRGNLALFRRNQTLPVWSTNISKEITSNSFATLLYSGNLVLLQNDTKKEVLWQSFDYPTNTLLPNMKLGLSFKTGLKRVLTSWKSPDDPGIGNYSCGIDPSRFPQAYLYKDSDPLMRAGSWTGKKWSGIPEIEMKYIFNVSYVYNDDEISITDGVTDASILTRMVISETGLIERFTWNNQANHWIEYLMAPTEKCDFYEHCGPNGYCNLDNLADFECKCFPGFQPKSSQQWYLNDARGGCVRKHGVSMCGNGEGFVKVARVKTPDTSKAQVEMSLGLKQCMEKCLRNCSCVAYATAYADNEKGIGCLTWHGDLVDTRTFTDAGQDLYIRVDADELARYTKKGPLQKKGMLAVVIVSVAVMFFIVVALHWLVRRQRRAKKRQAINVFGFTTSSTLLEDSLGGKEIDKSRKNANLTFFDLCTIAAATNNFSSNNKLGKGGFGSVYKGVLFNGKEIAVKRLSKFSRQGIEEFKNEVTLIAKLQHRNLVKILGFCIEKEEKILIYEYMPNKSLDSFIFDKQKRSLLDWGRRFEILCGIARGILYLHQDSRLRIIHRDLKVSNILLDADMNPKISDFGMARMFGGNQVEADTKRVVGTYGYMSPEYAMQGFFSIKSDVYSFGVLVLEIITGKRNSGYYPESPTLNLIGHVWELWRNDKAMEIIDSSLVGYHAAAKVLRCIQIGLLCVQDSAEDRPKMSTVVAMLCHDASLPTPKRPAFIIKKTNEGNETGSGKGISSVNEVTLTMAQPR